MKFYVYISFVVLMVFSGLCQAAPKPAIVPGPDIWTVDAVFEHPRQVVMQSTVDKSKKRFWYTILTLTNKTKRDVDFYPKCELMTDTFEVIPVGKGVSGFVFERIKKRHKSKYPFLEDLGKTGNKILQGSDNAKDVAVIWQDFDPKAKQIKLYISGLSNEIVVVNHPTKKDDKGKPVKLFLRKTLELSYSVSGDAALRSNSDLKYAGKNWVMR
jgi:hypothetical protein